MLDVDVAVCLLVLDRVGTVERYQPRASLTRESALHSSHSILHADCRCPSRRVQTEQRLLQAHVIALQRLLAPRLDPERCLVLVEVLLHVVQHQLRLARAAEPPHHKRPGAAICSIAGELRVDLVVQRASWNECPDGLERRVREVAGEVRLGCC